jgi:hypothetical protein
MHPKRGTSTGFTFGAFTDERDARLCLSLGSFKVGWTICDWQLSKSGAPRFAPRPRRQPKPTLAALGLQGEEEAARATSPSGARTAIATYRAPQQDLKLTVVDATGAVERTVMLMKGDFPLDTTGIVEEEGMSRTPGTLVALPAIVFLDEDRVAYHAPYFPCQVVDLESGVVNFQAPACAPPGLMVVRVGEARWVRLSATTDQWLAAPRIAAPCGAAQAAQLDLTPSVQER